MRILTPIFTTIAKIIGISLLMVSVFGFGHIWGIYKGKVTPEKVLACNDDFAFKIAAVTYQFKMMGAPKDALHRSVDNEATFTESQKKVVHEVIERIYSIDSEKELQKYGAEIYVNCLNWS